VKPAPNQPLVVMLYPLVFEPILKERVWGGRMLERAYGKVLPPEAPIGESWEISDRPGDASVIANGPLAGKDLRWLMECHGAEILGAAPSWRGRFPLLIKILDAREKLSLQVHPPAAKALALGGDPKTEMWYIAHAVPGAELFVGLKPGITRAEFERKLASGTVDACFHRVSVRAGDAMFLPSGTLTPPTACPIGTGSGWTAGLAHCTSPNRWPALTSTTSNLAWSEPSHASTA